MAENGAMFPEKSDIDSLIDKLKAFFDERSSDESEETPRQSIPTKPKYTDLNSILLVNRDLRSRSSSGRH